MENKTSKYFKYAIGEIILVVLGILIALQINNWNETLKVKKFEQEILYLIDQNLQQDAIAMTKELVSAKLAMQLTDSLLFQVKKKNYTSRLDNWMGKIICFERFKSQSSAFEVLKSKGLEFIADNKLQLSLISYYDQNLFKIYESLEDVEDFFQNDWNAVVKEEFSDFKWKDFCKPIDSKAFFEKPSTIVLFKIFKDNRKGTVRNIEATLKKLSEIRIQIRENKL